MAVLPQTPVFSEDQQDPVPMPPMPKRPWRHKFGDAYRGLKLGMRGHSSFAVHFFFAALVLAAAIALQCTLEQWCLLVGCMGMVLTAELFNSAVETLFRGLDEATKQRTWQCLDISAEAVLLACLAATIIGALIFLNRLINLLYPGGGSAG